MTATLVREHAAHLTPLQRLELLCDPGSVQVMRSRVISTRLGDRACYAQDGTYLGGSLG